MNTGIIYFQFWLHEDYYKGYGDPVQNLKIYKKSPVMRNTALFAIFSVVFLHVIESFVSGVSTFSVGSYVEFFTKHKFLLITLGLFCLTLFNGRKFSRYFYLLFIFQCIYLAFTHYLVALDKFVLILNFLFLILSYYFFLFMNLDLSEASNTPIANLGDIYSNLTLRDVVKIDSSRTTYDGHFINWDAGTCFLAVKTSAIPLKGKVEISWNFEGVSYKCEGEVVSRASDLGVGIRVQSQQAPNEGFFGWTDFYDIIHSRGYSPNLTA